MHSIQPLAHQTSGASMAVWEDEGGATGPGPGSGPVMRQTGRGERRLLEALGAAVLMRWNDLSTDARRAIFESAATEGAASDRLARFLRAHRNDAG